MYEIIVKQCMQSKHSFVWHQAKLNNYMHASVITYNASHWWHSNPSAWIKKSRPSERDFFGGHYWTRSKWNARNSETSEFTHIVSASSDLSLVQGVQIKSRQSRVWNHCETMYAIKTEFCMASSQTKQLHARKRDYIQCSASMTYQSFGLDKKISSLRTRFFLVDTTGLEPVTPCL